jgi:hypothetical protein
MLRFLLLATLALAWAQNVAAQSQDTPQNASSAGSQSGQVVVRGCLTGAAGAYVLIADDRGTPYLLRGNTGNLDRMIQHEVEITGQKVASQTSSSQSSTTNTDKVQHPPGSTLLVSAVNDIADTCAAKPLK